MPKVYKKNRNKTCTGKNEERKRERKEIQNNFRRRIPLLDALVKNCI